MLLRRLGSFLLEIIQVLVFAISIFLFLYLLVLQPHKIKGESMEPNFHNNEYLLTDKLTYRFNAPRRGDVVVFKAPPDDSDEFIKRIIGLPGEEVYVQNGSIYANGEKIDEKYLPDSFYTRPGKFSTEGLHIVIPSDSYFVLGDNRDHSYDSRNFGLITKDKITGRAWFVYWPPSKAGVVQHPAY